MADQRLYPSAPGETQYSGIPGDVPPSYDAAMAGGAGGFVEPNKTQSKYAPSYQPPQQPQQPQQAVIVQYVQLGPRPTQTVCPHCNCQILTRTESEPSATAWVLGFVLCLLCWPLSCVPCCIDSLQDVTHKCPNCKRVLGTYKS